LIYDVAWHERVRSDLRALSKDDVSRIMARVRSRLANDPAAVGKPLKGVFKGLFRYRVGPYRIVYAIDHTERRIMILHVRHRKDAYKKVREDEPPYPD
jgi:mRNA interferase RelE/StbE